MSKGAFLTLDTRGCALVLANCTITILAVAAGAPSRRPGYILASTPSIFKPLSILPGSLPSPPCVPLVAYPLHFTRAPVLCTLAGALKARQTEYYTNTRRPQPPSSVTRPPLPLLALSLLFSLSLSLGSLRLTLILAMFRQKTSCFARAFHLTERWM